MNKLINKALLSFIIICMAFSMTAMAADGVLTVTPSFDVENSELVIKGEITGDRGNIPVVLTVMRDDTLIDAQQIISDASFEGKSVFSFEPIPFENTTPSGDYDIYVSADYIGVSQSTLYTHDGVDKRFEALDSVNDAITADNTEALIEALSGSKAFICGGDEVLFDLSADAQDTFAKLLKAKGTYTQPQDYTTDENVATINSSLSELSADYKELLVIAEAVDINSVEKLDAWLAKYAEEKGFYTEDEDTPYSEVELAKYFDEAKSVEGFCSRLSKAAKEASDYDALEPAMLTAGVLIRLEEANYYGIREIAEFFKDLFTADWASFDNLSSVNQVAVCQKLTSLTFDDVQDFIDSFDNAVKAQRQNNAGNMGSFVTSSGSSGSSGSSKSGSKGSSVYVPVAGSALQSSVSGQRFTDLSGFEWAQEAIEHLYENKVIAGRGGSIFAPGAQVTRAEYIKMIVEAFGISTASYKGEFTDVLPGAWYAPYVASAYAAGIASGADGKFMPDQLISRQDMAVLLFRAKGMTASQNEKEVFTDSSDISDYAKSAVFVMYEKGIVLGNGDGTFAPRKNATRAEAAQMIYNMMMN